MGQVNDNPQDNVTLPRELLRQAIGALENPDGLDEYNRSISDEAITALRTVLEQPAPEINQCDGCRMGQELRNGLHFDRNGTAQMTCQAHKYQQPAPVQEPVMIYHGRCVIDCGEHGHHDVEMLRGTGRQCQAGGSCEGS